MTLKEVDLKGKKILFIAYFFPPVASTNLPGAMRTIKFIRNLTNGEFHVLTVPPAINEQDSSLSHLRLPVNGEVIHRIESLDVFKLLLSIRSGLKKLLGKKHSQQITTSNIQPIFKGSYTVEKSSASFLQKLKDFIYNVCYFPDQAGPWILPAYLNGKKLVREYKLDIIFATGSPWTSLIVGYLISKSTGIPLIADFRDPWVNNPFHQSKGKLLDRLSSRLERKVVKHAAAISLNTEPLMDEFLKRYPDIPADRFFVMPNGFDQTEFKGLDQVKKDHEIDKLILCHTGFLYGVRDPKVLLDSIKVANEKLSTKQVKIIFRQIGDVELSYDIHKQYESMIEDGSLLLEPPIPYQDCLKELTKADWLVNVQPATKSQVPSKLYDYLAINRPILNITPQNGALGSLVTKYGFGELFGFDDEQGLSEALIRIAESHKENIKFDGYPLKKHFDCSIIADTLAKKISRVTHTTEKAAQ
jgi:glycosyltransferase involved in cell wall biosynthesis